VALSLFTGLLFGWSSSADHFDQGSLAVVDWSVFMVFFLIFGASCALIQLFVVRSFYAHTPTAPERPMRGWKGLVHFLQTVRVKLAILITAVIGLSYGLGTGLFWGLEEGLNQGLASGLGYIASTGYIIGMSCLLIGFMLREQTGSIQLTERLRWTWSSFSKSLFRRNRLHILWSLTLSTSLLFGLGRSTQYILELGPAYGLTIGLSLGLATGLHIGLIYWLLSGLLQGIEQKRIEDQDRRVPNEGIRRSLRNSLITGIASGGIFGIITLLHFVSLNTLSIIVAYGLGFGRTYGPHYELGYLLNAGVLLALSNWLRFGPLISFCGGWLVCISMGGLAVWRHSVMRLLLWRSHTFPGRAPQFLDDACARFLLRRVGGGYSFIHRLLLDYFVATREKDV
jgi:hypothetical protein